MRRLTLHIHTPEGVIFSQTLAGPMSRFLAWLVDFAVVIGVAYVLNMVVLVAMVISPELAQAFGIILMFMLNIGYGIATEWSWRGQTIGKRAFGLRVVDAEGLRLQFSQVLLRNLLRAVDMLPLCYALGGTVALLSAKGQRLGDLAAGTVVVRIPKIEQPDIDQVVGGLFNSLRSYPHLVARLRQQATPADASLALQALLRREELDDTERVRVFGQLADHFKQLTPFPPLACEGLADEQYLRNVVDVLYRTQRRTPERRVSPEVAPSSASTMS